MGLLRSGVVLVLLALARAAIAQPIAVLPSRVPGEQVTAAPPNTAPDVQGDRYEGESLRALIETRLSEPAPTPSPRELAEAEDLVRRGSAAFFGSRFDEATRMLLEAAETLRAWLDAAGDGVDLGRIRGLFIRARVLASNTACSATYPALTAVTLTALPDASSAFAGWTGGACMGNPCVVTMSTDQTVTASFARPGGYLWSRTFGSSSGRSETGTAITFDAAGDVLVTGYFSGTMDLGGGSWTSAGLCFAPPGQCFSDAFVAKYSGVDGSHVWSRQLGGTGLDEGHGIAVDAVGDVFVVGMFENTVNFGGSPLTSAGSEDIFIAKYSGIDGSHLWSRRMGGASIDDAAAVAVDGADVVVTGYFAGAGGSVPGGGSVDFGGGPLTSGGAADMFLAKYSGVNGAHIWSERFGSWHRSMHGASPSIPATT